MTSWRAPKTATRPSDARPVARSITTKDVSIFTFRLFAALLLALWLLSEFWTASARQKWAAAEAHYICAKQPQPQACAPNGHPWAPIKALLESLG